MRRIRQVARPGVFAIEWILGSSKPMSTFFNKLNDDWNAEPNAPEPSVRIEASDLVLEFTANSFVFPRFREDQRIRLRFENCRRYRLGPTNDEGWYRGQCRFSSLAPRWGEFYEVTGDLKLGQVRDGWHSLMTSASPCRHFLFYLRDETFECEADDWQLEA